MTNGKIDPALTQELDRLAARGVAEPSVPVIIEHAQPARVSGEGRPSEQLARLEEQMRELQQGIMRQLHDLGVAETPRPLPLANGIATKVTRGQAMALSTHPDVKRIHLAREERVTT